MANAYVYLVIASGLAVIVHSLWVLASAPPGTEWFLLATLTLLTGSFTVRIPSLDARISVSETFVFTSVLLFGPAAGTVTVVLDALIASLWLKKTNRRSTRILFNAAAPSIAIWASSHVFFLMANAEPSTIRLHGLASLLAPLFLFASLYFAINTGLVAGALATQSDASAIRIWLTNFPSVSITYFVGASIAILIVAYTPRLDLSVLGIILPLLLISYLTFRTSLGRLEDANRHIAQVNELYMSTIETLAMAVDAKDQITHGHIRRVQVYATELAKRLGVSDERQLKAIEAAALLHDMGKLAIPEHILNKPGQLSPSEFEKMKKHANIGADLLSAIRFPYPVVPIVRHHHEHWDGKGYPSGIAGTDIPLGARILAVVDCFDALTSDRPYRPKLSNEAAFQILCDRRGSTYDPLIVDTLLSSFAEIAPQAIAAGQQAKSLIPSQYFAGEDVKPDGSLADIRANAVQASVLFEATRAIASSNSTSELVERIAQYARVHSPATICALYRLSAQGEVLTCIAASGEGSDLIVGITIPKAERISGWVVANSSPIANSDPVLDLGVLARTIKPPLESTLSLPLITSGVTIGALTFYSPSSEAFKDEHRYFLEHLAKPVADRSFQIVEASGGSSISFLESHRRRSKSL